MQLKLERKHIIYLLLCSLFLTSYISILGPNNNLFPDPNIFCGSSINGGSDHSSMNSSANKWQGNYTAAVDSSLASSVFTFNQNRLPNIKTTVSSLNAIIVTQAIWLICSSRLTNTICTQFGSIQITVLLHKKDGMK